jgi:hypothetical protein
MRHPDWPQRLAEYIDSRRGASFEWGTHDCCRFASGAVQAMTGDDPMIAFSYRNEVGATRLIRKAGSLDALVHRALGDPIPVANAKRGDVVISDLDFGATVGICVGAKCAFAAAEGGVTFRPLMMSRVAWGIN